MGTVVFWGLLLVVVVALIAAGLVFLVRRFTTPEDSDAVEAIGLVFAVVGVLYAIVLAFVVIAVWDKITAANENTYSEANALVDEYWYAQTLPTEQRFEIQRLCRNYAQAVITDEWSAMQRHKPSGIDGWSMLDSLRRSVENSRPVIGTDALSEVATTNSYEKALAQMDVLAESRAARMASATEGIPPVVWFVLIVGGLLTVGFGYLFTNARVTTQVILVVGLASAVALLLYAVYQLEYPFARQMAEGPAAFEFALERFKQIGR